MYETAFPTSTSYSVHSKGISIRDYFAAQVLQGMLASGKFSHTTPSSAITKVAYDWADLLVTERNK
jgi:hypothetical protein